MAAPLHWRATRLFQSARIGRAESRRVVSSRAPRRSRTLITSPVRRAVLVASRISGVQRLFRRRSQGPTVLFYHGVEERISDPIVQGMHFPIGLFEKQIRFLRREREVISLDGL